MYAQRGATIVLLAFLLSVGAVMSLLPDQWLSSPVLDAAASWWEPLALTLALRIVFDYARSAASA